jgi:hypothetical protein
MCGGGGINPISGQPTQSVPSTVTGNTPLTPILNAATTNPGARTADPNDPNAVALERLRVRMHEGLQSFFTSTASPGAAKQLDWRNTGLSIPAVTPPAGGAGGTDPILSPPGGGATGPQGQPLGHTVDPGVAALGPDFTDPTLETPLDNGTGAARARSRRSLVEGRRREDPIYDQQRRLGGRLWDLTRAPSPAQRPSPPAPQPHLAQAWLQRIRHLEEEQRLWLEDWKLLADQIAPGSVRGPRGPAAAQRPGIDDVINACRCWPRASALRG